MKETTQTLWFGGVALATVLLAVFTQPSSATLDTDSLRGKPLTEVFEVEEAKSLKIVKYNEETATLSEFEVAEQDGVWTIPSVGGYPADAIKQMAEASTTVMDREILSLVSQSAADHQKFGVVEPSANLDPGQIGVGTRVTLAKGDGSALVDLIIGKEVKDSDNQHYVRRTTQDVVFITEIDPNSLTTKFEDWIEDDLLKLNTFDLAKIQIKDYTSELFQRGLQIGLSIDQRSELTLGYDDSESAWTAQKLLAFNQDTKSFETFTLGSNEQLNNEVLNELKDALADLRIIDVEQKPEGLSSDLKAGEDFLSNQASQLSLMRRGFAPTTGESGAPEILSTEGELVCTLNNGVEYVLRFGNLRDDESSEDSVASAELKSEESKDLNRYLFVMAQFNSTAITPPELEVVPELPEASEESSEDSTNQETADEGSEDESVASDPLAQLKADREAIIQRNERALDEFEQKIETAKQRVEVLNERFGDWYYVVSNDVFKKMRLGREDVITKSDASPEQSPAEPGTAAGPFGSPGGAVPGLPNLSGLGNLEETSETEAVSEEAKSQSSEEPAVEEPVAEATEETEEAEPAGEATQIEEATQTEEAGLTEEAPAE